MEEEEKFINNVFLLVNGYAGHQSVGIMHVYKGMPVVVINFHEDPLKLPSGLFSFKKCSLLISGREVEYEKCVLKLDE